MLSSIPAVRPPAIAVQPPPSAADGASVVGAITAADSGTSVGVEVGLGATSGASVG